MTNFRQPLRPLRILSVLATVSLAGALACASTSAPAAPTGPVELNNTRWRLNVSRGKLDGRVIQFTKTGGQYVGLLKEKGLQLRNLSGVPDDMHIFEMQPVDANTYRGLYRSPNSDGSLSEREVNVTVSGDTMRWNLESASWERVE